MVLIVNKQNIDLEANEIITFPGKDKTYIKYKLVARAEHSGDSNGGHYWCLCVRGGKYYILNDSQIREISKSEFLRAGNNTYMILYTKI
jgi:ubiquitin C-terminal hydrolase